MCDAHLVAACLREEAARQRQLAAHAAEEIGEPDPGAVMRQVAATAEQDGPQVASALMARLMTVSVAAATAQDLALALDRIADSITEATP